MKKKLVKVLAGCGISLFAAVAVFGTNNIQAEAAAAKPAKTAVVLKTKKATVKSGTQKQIKAVVKNANGKAVKWTSSNSRVASVTKKGVVKGKKNGKATIRVKVLGTNASASCTVTVKRYKVIRVKTTGYCPGACCNGSNSGITALGTRLKPGRTIAVDPRVIPLRSNVEINGHVYRAEDTGGAIKGNRIDILFSSHAKADRWGVRYVNVKVYY